jgi:aspartokinase/homoserine dehydrogenase 1
VLAEHRCVVFQGSAEARVNVILITQASSEYSISFAVMPADSRKAEKAIKAEFHREMTQNGELKVTVEKICPLLPSWAKR